MTRSSVDLPEPLGPSSAVSEPSGTSSDDVVEGHEVAEALGHVGRRGSCLVSFRGLSSVIASSVASAMTREQRRGGVRPGEVEVLEAVLDEQRRASRSARRSCPRRR